MTTAAVIGCGDVSVVHLQAIEGLAGVELVGVCDTDAGRAGAAAQRYGVPAFADHRQLLEATRPRGRARGPRPENAVGATVSEVVI
ncbi:Gfo/Idh/MocA family oxidoreductase, partial [Actinoplanes sp. NPDC048791]|uniref:Gfo/Idh/MocA family oxidoreductase n=1 Tax=Actinoplanes sp. NPDC048791 TaxID=3154623 RepID=UPI003400C60A